MTGEKQDYYFPKDDYELAKDKLIGFKDFMQSLRAARSAIECRMNWEILQRPPYSPDLSPCDFHVFGLKETSERTDYFFIKFFLISYRLPSPSDILTKTHPK